MKPSGGQSETCWTAQESMKRKNRQFSEFGYARPNFRFSSKDVSGNFRGTKGTGSGEHEIGSGEKDSGEVCASSEAQASEEGPEGESADGDRSGDDESEEEWMGKPTTGASGVRISAGSK